MSEREPGQFTSTLQLPFRLSAQGLAFLTSDEGATVLSAIRADERAKVWMEALEPTPDEIRFSIDALGCDPGTQDEAIIKIGKRLAVLRKASPEKWYREVCNMISAPSPPPRDY